jgi:hypothetical protein
MELAPTARAVPFLPFRCSEEGDMLCPCTPVTESSRQSLFAETCHKAVLGVLLLVAGPRLWVFDMHLLRPIDGSRPLAILLSRDPP